MTTMNDAEKIEYRRKRNGWGWLIAVAWIVYWWVQKTDGSISAGASYLMMCVVAVLTAPFAFILSHYLARAFVEKQVEERIAGEEAALVALRRREETEQASRTAALQNETQQSRNQIDRGEFIRKIGTVRDYLGVLGITTDEAKRLLVRQAIDKELRDLIVKHSTDSMANLVRNDEAIRHSLASMLDMLSGHGSLSADAGLLMRVQTRVT